MKYISLLFFVFFSTHAQAGLMIEPILGTQSGTVSCTIVGGVPCDATVSGTKLGLHLGYKFMPMLWVAGNYEMNSGSTKNAAGTDNTTQNILGVDAGLDFILGIRAFVGLGLTNDLTVKATGGDVKFKGTTTKIGASFSPIPFFSFNLEYYMDKFTKVESAGVSYDVSTLYSKFEANRTVLSVSMPFDL